MILLIVVLVSDVTNQLMHFSVVCSPFLLFICVMVCVGTAGGTLDIRYDSVTNSLYTSNYQSSDIRNISLSNGLSTTLTSLSFSAVQGICFNSNGTHMYIVDTGALIVYRVILN